MTKPPVQWVSVPGHPEVEIADAPVTVAEYKQFLREHPGANRPAGIDEAGDDTPVVNVNYHEAQAYAKWAGARLPTDEEWQAALGEVPDEDEIPLYAVTRADHEREGPAPVRSKRENQYGIYDMLGNVWEWTSTPWESK